MCGVAGVLGRSDHKQLVVRMLEREVHRGPDGSGCWSSAEWPVSLGHQRLAIIDLSEQGKQPIESWDGRYILTFNGEIYNFAQLREMLVGKGLTFRGTGDSEVLVNLCACYGVPTALSKLRGMFAFGVWDQEAGDLWVARDPMGIKPLYVAMPHAGGLVFASEMKAMMEATVSRKLSPAAAGSLLALGYVPGTQSILQGIERLKPGTWLRVNARTGEAERGSYFDWGAIQAEAASNRFGSQDEALEALDSVLRESVRAHLVSDVPVNFFLSGGIDSSLLTAYAAQLGASTKAITVAVDDVAFDESKYAVRIAQHLGMENETLSFSEAEVAALTHRMVALADEPFADASLLPTHILCARAATLSKVAVSGDGGDEMFGGYNRHRAVAFRERIPAALAPVLAVFVSALSGRASLFRRIGGVRGSYEQLLSKLVTFLDAKPDSPDGFATSLYQAGYPEFAPKLPPTWRWQPETSGDAGADLGSDVERILWLDQRQYLPDDILYKSDRAGMAASLEVRVPYVDVEVLKNSWRLPVSLKTTPRRTKILLRTLLARYVPESLFERPKMGFSVPVQRYLRGPLAKELGDAIEALEARMPGHSRGFPSSVRDAFLTDNRTELAQVLWSVMMLGAWCEEWGIDLAN